MLQLGKTTFYVLSCGCSGVTLISPDTLDFPSTLTDLDYGVWMLSGSALMQDGTTLRNGYLLDLDVMTVSSRLGMMRHASGDLHFFFNGVDMGVAFTGLPQSKNSAIQFLRWFISLV